jgi:hypothetical protein
MTNDKRIGSLRNSLASRSEPIRPILRVSSRHTATTNEILLLMKSVLLKILILPLLLAPALTQTIMAESRGKAIKRAEKEMRRANFSEAEKIYRRLLEENREDKAARLGLSFVLLTSSPPKPDGCSGDSYAEPVSDSYLVGVDFPGARPGRKLKRQYISPLSLLFFHGAIALTCVCICQRAWFSLCRLQLISSAFKLLPGRLPARTAKFEFQRTERIIALMGQMGAQFNRGRSARDAKFISIQAVAMDGVFFRGFDN